MPLLSASCSCIGPLAVRSVLLGVLGGSIRLPIVLTAISLFHFYPPSHLLPLLEPGPFEPFILSVARLDAAKRIDLLLRALTRVPGSLRAVIAGRGPEQARLERLAADLRLGERVSFTGFLPDAEIAALYRRCRAVFYAPVDEDYGLSTIEAFRAGKPVITTPTPAACSNSSRTASAA